MKLSSFILSLSLGASAVVAHVALPLEERQSGFTPVTGMTGAVYPRLEVRQMLNTKPNQWTLFILAMQKFQAMPQNSKLSYYQIAGIHGVPRVNWDSVGQCSSCSGTDGYCTHDSVLFPAWHRTYMALFEQEFMTVVNQVAASYPASQRPAMQGAASTMRFPYWDWAAHPAPGKPTLPIVVSEKMISVNGPTGQVSIINPLFRHDFQDPSQMVYTPFTSWGVTLRYPNSDANSASSVEQSCTAAFDNIRASLQDQVFQLFSTCKDYLHFSNDDAGSSSTACSNSLEGIHNTVHTTAGGPGSSSVSSGHMTYLSTAAFDPIFWLHHANVDRLFAMWQAINPTAYGASQVAPHNTWTIAQGTTQDSNSPLTPFHKDTAGNFWTTNQVQDTKVFGYTYPEFANSDGSAAAINSYINKLYGPSATATAGSSKRTEIPNAVREVLAERTAEPILEAAADAVSNVTSALNNATDALEGALSSPLRAGNGSLFQYVANIQTPRYALNGSYSVYLFNGNPASEDPKTWVFDQNLIGPLGVMAQPGMINKNIIAAGSIPITRSLVYGVVNNLLTDLSEAVVVPYLTYNLKWRVAGPDGTSVDSKTIDGFNIAVYASTASAPSSPDELPCFSEFIELPEVTKGKTTSVSRA